MLSVPHLIVIFLVALVVLGPEKLPQVARVLGRTMADFRRITTDFRVQIEDEMREMERQARLRDQAAAAQASAAQAGANFAAELPAAAMPTPAPSETMHETEAVPEHAFTGHPSSDSEHLDQPTDGQSHTE